MSSNVKINFYNINFNNYNYQYIEENLFTSGGLYTFPSAPALSEIFNNNLYYKALKCSNYVFLDSSFFCYLIFIKTFKYFRKMSGLQFIIFLINYFVKNNTENIIFIEPSLNQAKKNLFYLEKCGLNKNNFTQYIAPIYKKDNIKDLQLIRLIKKVNPNFIIINLGGGVQEILGSYIKNSLASSSKANILCLGAAIAFRSGNQAPAPIMLDKLNITWFIRCLYNPVIFIPRYLKGLKLNTRKEKH